VLAAPDEQQPVAELLAATLRKLGYPTRVRIEADDSVYYELVSDPRRVPEAHLSRWGADLPVASSFAQLARCGNVGPGGLNTTGYCDQRSEQLIERALARQQVAPDEVAAAWQAVDRRLTDTVAWVPLVSTQGAVFASERVSTLVEVPLLGPAFERITLAPS
jgi:ABC-type transport system substrate-binding protein